jgi:M6 family metalloprotease-like protein
MIMILSGYRKIALMAVACVFLVPAGAAAMPALQQARTLEQPDGTAFPARQWGDERSHGWETGEGHEIERDPGSGEWQYVVRGADDRPGLSGRVVGRDTPPGSARQPRRTNAPRRAPGADSPNRPASAAGEQARGELVDSPRGTRNIPFVMADFSDTTTTYNAAQFNSLLFGTGTASLKDYYEEVSYGAFSVGPGPSGVSGWHEGARTRAYYGGNVWGYDAKPGTLVYEAAQKADAAGFDFSQYDSDGDCLVDVLAVVHQGQGEEFTGVENDIWSHSWDLASARYYGYSDYGSYTTNDFCSANPAVRMVVNNYIIMPERQGAAITTIGVFAHEYGHALGLPDLYDTDNSSSGAGEWSLMAGGGWNYTGRPGDSPAHLDPWSKYFLGWVPLRRIEGTWPSEGVSAADGAYDVYQLGFGTPLSGEYFLIENRRWSGFDAGLPGQGMLAWHIDGGWINSHYAANTVNDFECYPGGPSCATQHYGVAVVQADNLWELEVGFASDAGDPFPGTAANRSLNDGTAPSMRYYNGYASSLGVSSISDAAATMVVTLADGTTAPTRAAGTDQPTWTWATGGQAAWFGTARTSRDGVDAVHSGWIDDGQSTYLETTLNLPLPDRVHFYWKTSSQAGDALILSVDGSEVTRIDGETAWQNASAAVPAGTHTVRWTYAKNAAGYSGEDAAWIDQVAIGWRLMVRSQNPSGLLVGVDPADRDAQGDGTTPFSRQYADGQVVTLSAPVVADRVFRGWYQDGTLVTDLADCVVTMTGDHTLQAVYALTAGQVTGLDFNGNLGADLGVFYPANGTWYLTDASGFSLAKNWGWDSAIPVPADYDGDGLADIAVYYPVNGTWYITYSGGGSLTRNWGWNAAIPAPADYDGDGLADIAVYYPVNGTWYVAYAGGGTLTRPWGWNATAPVPADYDGDGKADFAVYYPTNGTWYIAYAGGGSLVQNWGWNGALPVSPQYRVNKIFGFTP